MKLLILTEGGASMGIGHISRCHAIAQALQKLSPANTVSSLIAADAHFFKFISRDLNGKIFDWRRFSTAFEAAIRRADAVLVDSYQASLGVLQKIAEWNNRIFFIDDFGRLPYPDGTVIVPAPYFKRMRLKKRKGVNYLGGNELVILREPFWKTSKIKINAISKNILLSLGGTAAPGLVRQIAMIANSPQTHIHAVVPEVARHKKQTGVTFHEKLSAEQMKKLMLRTDFAISAGGQTLYELASCGIPTVAFELAANQRLNLEALNSAGAILYAGKKTNSDFFKKIRFQINRLSDSNLRRKLARAGAGFVPRNGAISLAQIISKGRRRDDFTIRPVNKKDCLPLWVWRNNRTTRRFSIQQDFISYETHLKWFRRQLSSKNTQIQIGVLNNGKMLGQVRFEKNSSLKTSIHINLSPAMRGKGLGAALLIQSTKRYFEDHRSIQNIEAEILTQNEASQRAFQSAGFLAQGFRSQNGRELSVYILRRNDV